MNPVSRLFIMLIRAYQLCVSPWLGANCRFSPSCSAYGIEAIKIHGPAKGAVLTASRLCRCHPFARDGYDPVPTPHNREPLC